MRKHFRCLIYIFPRRTIAIRLFIFIFISFAETKLGSLVDYSGQRKSSIKTTNRSERARALPAVRGFPPPLVFILINEIQFENLRNSDYAPQLQHCIQYIYAIVLLSNLVFSPTVFRWHKVIRGSSGGGDARDVVNSLHIYYYYYYIRRVGHLFAHTHSQTTKNPTNNNNNNAHLMSFCREKPFIKFCPT